MFAEPEYAKSDEYKDFWAKLNEGQFFSGEFRRLAKGGKEVWVQASYNPILNNSGTPTKVVKFASDITAQKHEAAYNKGQIEAIGRSQAVIEFDLDGKILWANENFLAVMGYTLKEIKGKHHSMFAEPEYAKSDAYKDFWAKLKKGEFFSGDFRRLAKGGKEVWINASYNPILDGNGNPFKVVKFASDITEQKHEAAYNKGQIDAIGRSQAVIEFDLDGNILWANENFLSVMGYSLDEVQGQHHSMFAEPSYANSGIPDFWAKLKQGQFFSGEYRRLAKGGREVWINASYNPILDGHGDPFKVVKFASDITDEKHEAAYNKGQIEAIGRSQAVIEFDLDGRILWANENFLSVMGYRLDEIQGRHHSMFAEPEYANSNAYREFWTNLARGQFSSGEFKRVAKGGREVWINASYNPILDGNGQPFKVVKFASDITEEKHEAAYNKGQIDAHRQIAGHHRV